MNHLIGAWRFSKNTLPGKVAPGGPGGPGSPIRPGGPKPAGPGGPADPRGPLEPGGPCWPGGPGGPAPEESYTSFQKRKYNACSESFNVVNRSVERGYLKPLGYL